MFASVGDDKLLNVSVSHQPGWKVNKADARSWDTRSQSSKAAHSNKAHGAEINAVAFAPSSEYLILTGSADNVSPEPV